MLNKYPLWKNLVILVALTIGFVYALPNLFPDDYAIQITGARSSTDVSERTLERAVGALEGAGIEVKESELQDRDALIRLNSSEAQAITSSAIRLRCTITKEAAAENSTQKSRSLTASRLLA